MIRTLEVCSLLLTIFDFWIACNISAKRSRLKLALAQAFRRRETPQCVACTISKGKISMKIVQGVGVGWCAFSLKSADGFHKTSADR